MYKYIQYEDIVDYSDDIEIRGGGSSSSEGSSCCSCSSGGSGDGCDDGVVMI